MEFFFIDTTPFVNDYWSAEEERDFDWRGLGPRQEYLAAQIEVWCLTLFPVMYLVSYARYISFWQRLNGVTLIHLYCCVLEFELGVEVLCRDMEDRCGTSHHS